MRKERKEQKEKSEPSVNKSATNRSNATSTSASSVAPAAAPVWSITAPPPSNLAPAWGMPAAPNTSLNTWGDIKGDGKSTSAQASQAPSSSGAGVWAAGSTLAEKMKASNELKHQPHQQKETEPLPFALPKPQPQPQKSEQQLDQLLQQQEPVAIVTADAFFPSSDNTQRTNEVEDAAGKQKPKKQNKRRGKGVGGDEKLGDEIPPEGSKSQTKGSHAPLGRSAAQSSASSNLKIPDTMWETPDNIAVEFGSFGLEESPSATSFLSSSLQQIEPASLFTQNKAVDQIKHSPSTAAPPGLGGPPGLGNLDTSIPAHKPNRPTQHTKGNRSHDGDSHNKGNSSHANGAQPLGVGSASPRGNNANAMGGAPGVFHYVDPYAMQQFPGQFPGQVPPAGAASNATNGSAAHSSVGQGQGQQQQGFAQPYPYPYGHGFYPNHMYYNYYPNAGRGYQSGPRGPYPDTTYAPGQAYTDMYAPGMTGGYPLDPSFGMGMHAQLGHQGGGSGSANSGNATGGNMGGGKGSKGNSNNNLTGAHVQDHSATYAAYYNGQYPPYQQAANAPYPQSYSYANPSSATGAYSQSDSRSSQQSRGPSAVYQHNGN